MKSPLITDALVTKENYQIQKQRKGVIINQFEIQQHLGELGKPKQSVPLRTDKIGTSTKQFVNIPLEQKIKTQFLLL